jgi:hypothetical protein
MIAGGQLDYEQGAGACDGAQPQLRVSGCCAVEILDLHE